MFADAAHETTETTFDAGDEAWFAELRPNASPSWRPAAPAPSLPPPSLDDSFVDRWFV
ncbi:MAG: hypothetical protein KF819_11975 [Labilithrix sp.]|nr:hypothetical protein [Labilithrix sp.]